MHKSTIFTVLASFAALAAAAAPPAGEPESTTTLTSTSTLTKTITLTNCNMDNPECTYIPEPTPTPEPSTSEEPSAEPTYSAPINATASFTPSKSRPVVVVTQTSVAGGDEPTPAPEASEPAIAGAGSLSVHGGLLAAAVLGFLALN